MSLSTISKISPRTGDRKKDLDHQRWYHGLCSRDDVELLLNKRGDFLVRVSEHHGALSIVLSLSTGERKLHLTIAVGRDGLFYLSALGSSAEKFSTVYDLVGHYMKNAIKYGRKGKKELLRFPVQRPKWMVKSGAISFDPNEKPLGCGHFAKVYRGIFRVRDENGKREIAVAIKVLKEKMGHSDDKVKQAKQAMIREGRAMSYYNHPNVVQFYGLSCDSPQQVTIVLEYCPGGSLHAHLIAQKADITVGERLTYCYESALGMRYLHSKKCVHRDLAARNCLISAQGVVKIADFGMSTADESVVEQQSSRDFPIRWMAPETIVKENQSFSLKSDIWSYGVLIYEVFNNGEKPWPNVDKKKIADSIVAIKMPELPSIMPKPIQTLMSLIWIKEMSLRPSFRFIVRHLGNNLKGDLAPPNPADFSVNRIPDVRRVEELTIVVDTGPDDDSMESNSTVPSSLLSSCGSAPSIPACELSPSGPVCGTGPSDSSGTSSRRSPSPSRK